MAPHTTFGENPISAARCHTRTREIARATASLDGCRSRGIKDIKSLPPRTAVRKRVSGPMVNCI